PPPAIAQSLSSLRVHRATSGGKAGENAVIILPKTPHRHPPASPVIGAKKSQSQHKIINRSELISAMSVEPSAPPPEGVRVEETSYGTCYLPNAAPKEARSEKKKHRNRAPGQVKNSGDGASSSSSDSSDDESVPGPPVYENPTQQLIQQVPQKNPTPPRFMMQSTQSHVMSVEFYPICQQKGNQRLDISPRFESFSTLMAQANHWLSTHPDFRCMRCETIPRPATFDGVIDYAGTHTRGSKFGSLVFVRGLRMWVTQRNDIPMQQLWYINVLPKPAPKTDNSLFPEFEDLKQTCDAMNMQFGVNPLPGTILNMEQMELLFQRWGNKRNIDLDKTYQLVRQDKGKFYLIGLRIYYMVGPPLNEKIGIVSLLPEATHRSGMQRPKFSDYTSLVNKAIKWIGQNHANVRVTDLQSFRLFVNMDGGDLRWKEWAEVENPYRSHSVDRSSSVTSFMLTTLRIIFTYGGPQLPLLQTGLLTTKVFVPFKTGDQSYESVQMTCGRIASWMNVTKPRIVSAETIQVFHPAEADEVKHANCDVMLTKLTNHSYVTCFRFFIDGVVPEPTPDLLPPPPRRQTSSCCVVL
ncbi:hypothetical protein BOX15_Mlig026318g1, partial [Macrostomum lignano]